MIRPIQASCNEEREACQDLGSTTFLALLLLLLLPLGGAIDLLPLLPASRVRVAGHTEEWQECWREHEGKRWDELPFFWLEAYFYRYRPALL